MIVLNLLGEESDRDIDSVVYSAVYFRRGLFFLLFISQKGTAKKSEFENRQKQPAFGYDHGSSVQ